MGRRGWMLAGTVLVVLGVIALFVEGLTYVTREEVIEIGPLEVTTEREERVPLPAWIGGILVGSGAILLVVGVGAPDGRGD